MRRCGCCFPLPGDQWCVNLTTLKHGCMGPVNSAAVHSDGARPAAHSPSRGPPLREPRVAGRTAWICVLLTTPAWLSAQHSGRLHRAPRVTPCVTSAPARPHALQGLRGCDGTAFCRAPDKKVRARVDASSSEPHPSARCLKNAGRGALTNPSGSSSSNRFWQGVDLAAGSGSSLVRSTRVSTEALAPEPQQLLARGAGGNRTACVLCLTRTTAMGRFLAGLFLAALVGSQASDLLPAGRSLLQTALAYGDNGSVSCSTYCGGSGGGPWNGELPNCWNGAACLSAKVAATGSSIPCSSTAASSLICTCYATGAGWAGATRPPPPCPPPPPPPP